MTLMSSRRRHVAHEEEHENHERWLVSYADMMTLLFALFLVLYAMSMVDLKKFQAFRKAFDEGLGNSVQALPEEGNPLEGDPDTASPGLPLPAPTDTVVNAAPVRPAAAEVVDRRQLESLKAQLEAAVASAGLAGKVSVALDDRGVAVFVTDGVLFPSGSADLLPVGQGLLDGLVPVLAGVGNKLVVEGHTDDVPIASPTFPSNWELSTTRATTVLRRLLAAHSIDPARLSAAGYADTRPRVPNDSDEHRAGNRRVEVIVVAPPAPDPVEAPVEAAPAGQPPAEAAGEL